MLDFLFILEKAIMNKELLKMFGFVFLVLFLMFRDVSSVLKTLLTVIVAYSIFMSVII